MSFLIWECVQIHLITKLLQAQKAFPDEGDSTKGAAALGVLFRLGQKAPSVLGDSAKQLEAQSLALVLLVQLARLRLSHPLLALLT
jgi:hypothetical protein